MEHSVSRKEEKHFVQKCPALAPFLVRHTPKSFISQAKATVVVYWAFIYFCFMLVYCYCHPSFGQLEDELFIPDHPYVQCGSNELTPWPQGTQGGTDKMG